jgi:hypothetical protein
MFSATMWPISFFRPHSFLAGVAGLTSNNNIKYVMDMQQYYIWILSGMSAVDVDSF